MKEKIPAGMDYLKTYIQDGAFDVPRLIHDDFFVAIKLCFNNKKYISCTKLLMSFIDTMGFVEFGNDASAFIKWLKKYVDLSKLNLTAEELWEHRNALLHMSTLESRKIEKGLSPILVAYIGNPILVPKPPPGEKWYDLHGLLMEIKEGIGTFIKEYVENNIESFIERYDKTLSDTRYLILEEQ